MEVKQQNIHLILTILKVVLMRKVQYLIFSNFLLVLTKVSFWEED